MTAERRNLPMSAAEMRAHAAAAGKCPHCDLMWRGFVAATADADEMRQERDQLRAQVGAGEAVAQLWDGFVGDTTNDNPLWYRLDELARAHEVGGTDR